MEAGAQARFFLIHEEMQIEVLVDQVIAAARRSPRFRTDPVAAIYATYMELGRELSGRMKTIRAEQRQREVVRQ